MCRITEEIYTDTEKQNLFSKISAKLLLYSTVKQKKSRIKENYIDGNTRNERMRIT